MTDTPPRVDPATLRADCASCAALCCVVPTFAASAEFAIDKPAGRPCPHLSADFRCGIHDALRQRGFAGCATYDCFGAGQALTAATAAGAEWWRDPETAHRVATAFPLVRQVRELLWHVVAALDLPLPDGLRSRLAAARDDTARLASAALDHPVAADIAAHRDTVNRLLLEASETVRARLGRRTLDRRGAELVAARLAGADLRGASLRGARLVAADLRRADLRVADLTGADLRAADLAGADLTGALFLTQAQLDAARGDPTTRISPPLRRPAHWSDRR